MNKKVWSTKKLRNIQQSNSSKYEWIFYAYSYLGLARIGCNELINQKYRNKRSLMDDLLYGTKKSMSRYLLISIFFNIKHALELLIKGSGVNLDRKYWKSHDIDFLLNDFERRVKTFLNLKHEDKIFKKISEIKPIIQKYFCCEFLEGIKGAKDFQNELFRYPESSDKSLASYSDFFKKSNIFEQLENFDIAKIKMTLEDIDKIHRLFAIIQSRISLSKMGIAKSTKSTPGVG